MGLEELRPGQGEAIEHLLAGRDCLVVMPTGSGKSAVYQLAGHLLDGPTLVVSPLIALQRDQVTSIGESDIGDAAAANSTISAKARRQIFDDLRPASSSSSSSRRSSCRTSRPGPSCGRRSRRCSSSTRPTASRWGHDFRPEYLRLGAAVAELGRPTVLALTATASPVVRDEIVERLGLRDPVVIVRGFDRPEPLDGGAGTASPSGRRRDALLAAVPRPLVPRDRLRRHPQADPRDRRAAARAGRAAHRGVPRRHGAGRAARGAGAVHGRTRST